MKAIRKYGVEVISALFILLLVYASFSKALDFVTFQAQLEQSPVIGTYAEVISYGVLLLEIIVALMLGLTRTRLLGFYGALSLMIMFTVYIIIIMHFAPFTPCSCGGILNDMGWKEHFIFNLCFIILAIIGINLIENTYFKPSVKIGTITLVSTLIMIGIYRSNRYENQNNNSFQRIYLPHHATKYSRLDLKQTGFTIAGLDSCYVYLTHVSAPLYLLQYDYHAHRLDTLPLKIEHQHLPYRRLITQVDYPYYTIGDGTVGRIELRKLNTDHTPHISYSNVYYNSYTHGTKYHTGIVASDPKTKSNLLGVLYQNGNKDVIRLNKTSLKKQINGTFDTDGQLIWNASHQLYLYGYYYRNEIIVLDSMMNEKYIIPTIDTIKNAQIDMKYYPKTNQYKIGPKTIRVNEHITTYDDQLYISSKRLGPSEEEIKGSSIIDTYDLLSKKYLYSFYLYHLPEQRLRNFKVYQNYVAGIFDQELYLYNIK